jgi:protein-S-isoprenylcysteine O-methyltransferase Ste14
VQQVHSAESTAMKVAILATVLCGCWWTAESIRSSRQDKTRSRDRDRGSSKLWDVAHFVGVIGVIVGFTDVGHVQRGEQLIKMSGFGLMVAGISVRWLAIHTLGKYFTGKVRIFEDHRLIRNGLYQHVRHPAYAGDLIAYLGFGLVFSNWISLVLIFCPILLVALYRMRIEERVLRDAFGQEYLDYMEKTKRLFLGIY